LINVTGMSVKLTTFRRHRAQYEGADRTHTPRAHNNAGTALFGSISSDGLSRLSHNNPRCISYPLRFEQALHRPQHFRSSRLPRGHNHLCGVEMRNFARLDRPLHIQQMNFNRVLVKRRLVDHVPDHAQRVVGAINRNQNF